MTAINIGKRLKAFVESHGSNCGAGVTQTRISVFERENGIQIPEDLKRYFAEVNGTEGDYAYGIVRFWSIDECRSLKQVISETPAGAAVIQAAYSAPIQEDDQYFVFADYLHESQLYAIRLSPSDQQNPVILLDGGEPVVVAESLSDFVERYLTSPEDLRLEAD